jgi:hypothetical protein
MIELQQGRAGSECFCPASVACCQESVGLRVNLLQIRLDGPYFAAFLGNRATITLQNQQNLSSTSRIFASIS